MCARLFLFLRSSYPTGAGGRSDAVLLSRFGHLRNARKCRINHSIDWLKVNWCYFGDKSVRGD
jgi:hypothetical protein